MKLLRYYENGVNTTKLLCNANSRKKRPALWQTNQKGTASKAHKMIPYPHIRLNTKEYSNK